MKQPIGLTIKEIVQKKNLSPADLADKLGTSRQTVYNTYNRGTLHEGEIAKWADALEVSKDELLHPERYVKDSPKNIDFGAETLQTIKRLLDEELREKNEQIRSLQESLRESQKLASQLLGKLHEYSYSPVIPSFPAAPRVGAAA